MNVAEIANSIINPKVRSLFLNCMEKGLLVKFHEDKRFLNIHDPVLGINIIGDLNTTSKDGYFRIKGSNGRFYTFRNKEFGLNIKEERFIEKIWELLKGRK